MPFRLQAGTEKLRAAPPTHGAVVPTLSELEGGKHCVHSQLGAGRRLCRPHGPLSLPLLKEARASEIPHPRSGPRSPPGLPQQGSGWGTAELADRLSEGATAPRASSHPGPRDQAWQVSLSPPGAKPALSKASWQGACRPSRPLSTVSGAPVCSG